MSLKVVITHINPDFDALSTAYTVCKIYNCDYVIYTTGFDDNLKKFLRDYEIEIPLKHINEIVDDEIELLVITDCKMKDRVGDADVLISKAKKIIVYDHHPVSGKDIEADEEYIFNFGSTATILAQRIKTLELEIDEKTATFLLLGIYEDTGSLTFNNTTPTDLYAAAFLLEEGADLSAVPVYLNRELSKSQVFILNQLLQNLTLLKIAHFSVGVSYASYDEYVGEVAVLTQKIMNIEGLDALFVLVRVEDKVLFIGRSSVEEIDVSKVAEGFRGGGHVYAASATIKDMTLQEALDKLKYLIKENIKPIKLAKDFMTYPVKFIEHDKKFKDALDLFMKYNLNTMPVVKDGKTVGLISRKDILQGIKHGLSDEPVSSIMQTEFYTVNPETPFFLVEDIILDKRQKLVPVEENGRLVGVITRTDFIRAMSELNKTPKYIYGRISNMDSRRFKNVKSLMKEKLPEKLFNILKRIGELADELNMGAYVVGGFVRDLIMRIENFDIDIVVEGDAVTLAKKFAKETHSKVSAHYKFKTAVVIMPDGFRVDFATARTEYYDFPAAAPVVEDSSIKTDLYRRDFTINTMAIKLNSKEFGRLIDYFGAQADIRDKKIRVLHNLSFVDDPSRIFRAIRFAVRYNFEIGPHTERLLKHAVNLKLIDRVFGQRLFLEIKYILSEKNYLNALKMLDDYNILTFFHEKAKLTETKINRFEYLEKLLNWFNIQFEEELENWKIRFLLLFHELKAAELQKLLTRFEFAKNYKKQVLTQTLKARNSSIRIKKEKEPPPSFVYNQFKELETEFVIYSFVILGEKYESLFKDYFLKIRNVKLEISGDDLIKAGLIPSKIFKKIFDRLIELKVDGILQTKEDELDMALKLYRELECERSN